MKPVTGWVYWRGQEAKYPSWQFGQLEADPKGGLKFTAEADRPGEHPRQWIIPGLVDAHNHLQIGGDGPVSEEVALDRAIQELSSGVLALRDLGNPHESPAHHLARAPRLVTAGRHLARPKRYLPGLALEVEDQADLPAAVAQQVQAGNPWVKLVGDWIDRSRGSEADLDPLWDRAVLIDAVQTAHELGARVAVHVFGRSALDDLFEAGVDSIEHGTGMTWEHCQEAAARGITVTPTLGQVELFPQFAGAATRYPNYAQTMINLYQNWRTWWANLVEARVQLLPGSDAGGYQPHGQLFRELYRWEGAGLDATTIIDYATWQARDFLGFDSLSTGAPADFLVLRDDPMVELTVLGEPLRIVFDGQDV
ncbi:amidohydrolase family protein [Scrofimicrobium sp. R131]|uniref:Amidohydrolase family protein n=1 Tax=Scrofimicrobium appendicitidis TaxID=3079930 RepID=A0AAU7V592_9ACTO